MPDRWEKTSFVDTTEAAIHCALIQFILAVEEREKWSNLSDLYITTRRLVRDLATGSLNPEEYLDSLESVT